MDEPLASFRELHRACHPTCITQRCGRSDCSLSMSPQEAVCIDCDACASFKQSEGAKKPDFILLAAASTTNPTWLVVEMKSRLRDPESVVEQLQAGASVIQSDPCFEIAARRPPLVPILLHSRGVHASDVEILNRRRVSFGGRNWPIVSRRCGAKLADLLP